MVDLRRRPFQPIDASAVARLTNLIEAHAGGHPGYTEAEVAALVAELTRDPELDTTLVFAPDPAADPVGDGTLIAFSMNTYPPTDGYIARPSGGVHPDWRGRGIGRELMAAQLDRIASVHQATAPERDWEAQAGTMVGDEEAVRLFRRFGFSPVRYWFDMVASTTQTATVALPDGLSATSYRPEDEKATYEAHTEAFQDHWGYQGRERPAWAALTVGSLDFLPELSRLAWQGDELAGYVLSYRDAEAGRLYIGHVGTRRPWRRTGVAGGLLSLVLAAAKEAGYTTAALGVDADSPTGAVGAYSRVGFEVFAKAVTYSLDLRASA